ncbi:MAG: hypothetical protein BroJett011_76410 [Chloroflexota bacterium]|nr:MAG: hypothetical protein BroJett011_76410 [Chloroflexota bacterium]
MTQIITVITHEYILLASDRRVTFISGMNAGSIKDDDRCKLVNLCNTCVIGYTGLAEVEGTMTHEWLLHKLAAANCQDPYSAARIISEDATRAFSNSPLAIRRHLFILAGWAYFEDLDGLRPHFCVISNSLDEYGKWLSQAKESFDYRARALRDEEGFLWYATGARLTQSRQKDLERNIRRLMKHEIGPKSALRLLSEEIVHTSRNNRKVGNKVLSACIPKRSVINQIAEGHFRIIAEHPELNTATFTYFDPSSKDLRQFGPAFVCGGMAVTDVETESRPDQDYQSSQLRIISLPKKGNDLSNSTSDKNPS